MGPDSLSNFIKNKFKILDQIISSITQKQERNPHREKIIEAATKMKELIISESKYIQLICSEKHILQENSSNTIETLESDIKNIQQQFSEYNYHTFPKCYGISQGELSQYKTQFLTNCNEIITSIRAFFSFDKDFDMINSEIKPITEHIEQIVSIAELPPSPLRTLSSSPTSHQHSPFSSNQQTAFNTFRSISRGGIDSRKSTRSTPPNNSGNFPQYSVTTPTSRTTRSSATNSPPRPNNAPILTKINPRKKDKKGDPLSRSLDSGNDNKMDNLKDFVQSMKSFFSPYDKQMIKQLYHLGGDGGEDGEELNGEEDQNEEMSDADVWTQMELIKQKLPELIQQIKKNERTKDEVNPEEVQKMKQDFEKRENEYKKRISEIEKKAEISDQYAHSLEDQIKTMEQADENLRGSKTLQRVISKMSQIVSETDDELPLMTDSDTESTEKMNLFIFDRKCKNCLEHEKFEYDLLQKLGADILGDSIHDGMTFQEKIKLLPQKIDEMKAQIVGLKQEIDDLEKIKQEKENTIQKMKNVTEEIRTRAKDMNDDYHKKLIESLDEDITPMRRKRLLEDSDKHQENLQILNESEDMAKVAMSAFEAMKEIHTKELEAAKKEIEQKHKEQLKELAEALNITDDESITAIINGVLKVKQEMEQTRAEINEKDRILKRVDNWMRDHIVNLNQKPPSEAETKQLSLEQQFHNLMFQFDETPNPLSKPYEELSNERRKTRSDLEENVIKMSKIFPANKKTPQMQQKIQNVKTLKPLELMTLHSNMLDTITKNIGGKDEVIHKQKKAISDSKDELKIINNKLLEFLGVPKIKNQNNSEEEEEPSIYDLIQKLSTLIDEICNSGNQNFVSSEFLNKAISPVRNLLKTPSLDPRVFIPQLVSLLFDASRTIQAMEAISTPLSKAFEGFDFTKTPKIDDPQFINARDYVFHVNSLIHDAQASNKDTIGSKAIDVLSQFVSITSSMFSLVAMICFGTPGASIAKI